MVDGFGVERSNSKVKVRLGYTAIRRGFERYECLLVMTSTDHALSDIVIQVV